MITRINIKGYKSLTDATIDFKTSKNIADKNNEVIKKHKLNNNGFVYTFNLAGIIGANATGKSSFIDAIYIYQSLVMNRLEMIKEDSKSFFDLENQEKEFSFEYLIDGEVLKHHFLLTSKFEIILEELFYWDSNEQKGDWKLIFSNNANHSLLWRVAEISQYEKENFFKISSENINLINKVFSDVKEFYFFDNRFEDIDNDHFLENLKQTFKHIFKFRNLEANAKKIELLKSLIAAVDPNIIDLEYDDYSDDIIVIVRNNKKDFKVAFENISKGTKRFVHLMITIFENKNRTSFYFIDEIEKSFHPKIVETILSLFYFNENNISNSQLIFTTHNPYIFNMLDIHNSCINIGLYDDETNFDKLSNFKNYDTKRNDKLFSKNYMLEIIKSHPDSNSISDIYDYFSSQKDICEGF